MNKIQNFGTSLSRSEMKNVNGGGYQCTFTYEDGTTSTVSYGGTGTEAQCAADHSCLGNDFCTNVDCAGSGAC